MLPEHSYKRMTRKEKFQLFVLTIAVIVAIVFVFFIPRPY